MPELFEYLVIDISVDTQQVLQHRLDVLCQDGWKVVCDSKSGLILEREKRKTQDESSYYLKQLINSPGN